MQRVHYILRLYQNFANGGKQHTLQDNLSISTTADTIKQLALWHARGQWGSGSLIRLLFMHFSFCLQIRLLRNSTQFQKWPFISAHDQFTLTQRLPLYELSKKSAH